MLPFNQAKAAEEKKEYFDLSILEKIGRVIIMQYDEYCAENNVEKLKNMMDLVKKSQLECTKTTGYKKELKGKTVSTTAVEKIYRVDDNPLLRLSIKTEIIAGYKEPMYYRVLFSNK